MGLDLVVLVAALTDFYSNVDCIDEALEIFHNLDRRKDGFMLNYFISWCVLNRRHEEEFLICGFGSRCTARLYDLVSHATPSNVMSSYARTRNSGKFLMLDRFLTEWMRRM